MKRKLASLFILAVVLGGCLSVAMATPSTDAEAKAFKPEAGKANLYLSRQGTLGPAAIVQIVFGGRVVGYILLSVSPREHTILSSGCMTEMVDQLKLKVDANKNYFVDVSLSIGWDLPYVHFTQVGDDQGRSAVLKTKRAESTNY